MTRRSKIALLILLVAVSVMGRYAWRLKRKAEQLPARSVDTRPAAPPVTGRTGNITLLVADDEDGLLHRQPASVALPEESSERALQVARALIAAYQQKGSHHRLAEGADVDAAFFLDSGTVILDVNKQFAAGHPAGMLAEQLTLASFAQTLAADVSGVTRVKILVEGKEQDTLAGHADILSFYDVSADPWPVAR